MKRLILSSISILLLTNIIYSQDIINETGQDGKFIVRDAEQQEQLRVEEGNVAITGELKVGSMTEGTATDAMVVWDRVDKSLKVVPRIFSKVSPLSEPLDTGVGHSIVRGHSLDENNNEISSSVQGTAVIWNYLTTDHGYIRFGPSNKWWAHIYTDRDAFIFNKPFYALDGSFGSYRGTDLTLATDFTTRMTILDINGNVGIGTATPSAKLHVSGNDGFLLQGTYGNGVAQSLGTGTRMHFYPKRSAFRVGYINGAQWDDTNIGNYSTALGINTTANGNSSTAMGNYTMASGSNSTSMNSFTTASGSNSTAMGLWSRASGDNSTTMGHYTVANAYASTAMGYETMAESFTSTVVGRYNMGGGNATSWVEGDPLFEIGIGTGVGAKLNALTVLKNGRVGIGTNTPGRKLDVVGNTSSFVAMFKNQSTHANASGIFIESDVVNPGNNNMFVGFLKGNNAWSGWINGDGAGGVNYATVSDARLKINVIDSPSALDKLSNIRVRQYEMKFAPGKKQIGFLAQELQEIYPQAVSGNSKDDASERPMGIDYGKLTPLLVKAIQELQARIEVLENK